MIRIFGALLIVVGLVAIIFGSKTVQSDRGLLKGFFRAPRANMIAVKWAAGLLCIWFGAYMLITATVP